MHIWFFIRVHLICLNFLERIAQEDWAKRAISCLYITRRITIACPLFLSIFLFLFRCSCCYDFLFVRKYLTDSLPSNICSITNFNDKKCKKSWSLGSWLMWQGIEVESFIVRGLGFFRFEIREKYVPQGKFRKICTEVTISLWWCSQGWWEWLSCSAMQINRQTFKGIFLLLDAWFGLH